MATFKYLDDIIDEVNQYDYNKVVFYTETDDESLIIADTDLFSIYRKYVNNFVATYKVTKKQREYYRFKPYLLSSDVYGTPNLAWLILMLNDQECASKFRIKQTIQLISPDLLSALYDTVVTKSNDKLNTNWNEYLPLVDA